MKAELLREIERDLGQLDSMAMLLREKLPGVAVAAQQILAAAEENLGKVRKGVGEKIAVLKRNMARKCWRFCSSSKALRDRSHLFE